MQLDKIISALKYCSKPSQLLELEKRLNTVGLTVQQSQAGRVFLCRITEGRPACGELFEDHIPICDFDETLDDRARNMALEFIMNNATSPKNIKNDNQKGNFSLYGSSLQNSMIKAISEWIE